MIPNMNYESKWNLKTFIHLNNSSLPFQGVKQKKNLSDTDSQEVPETLTDMA